MNKFASLSVLDAEAINTKKMNASNPPTRKRNLLTVWMDPELWATLPEPLIEQVLAYLPLPILLQLRAVCKKWDALLRHPTFLRTQAQLSPQRRSHVLTVSEPAPSAFSFFQHPGRPELYYLRRSLLYCPVSCDWFRVCLDSCLPFSDLYVTSVSSGLICFVAYKGKSTTVGSTTTGFKNSTTTATATATATATNSCKPREVVIGVCNPATRTWRLLPRWSSDCCYNLPSFVALIVEPWDNSYQVVVIDFDQTTTRMWSSASSRWSESDHPVPTQHNFPYYDRTPSEPVVQQVGGARVLVCASQCKTGISTYDMDSGMWESHQVFLPHMHSNVHLVQHRGRMLLISRVMLQKYEGSDRVQVSELDRKGLHAINHKDVPAGPSKQFLDHFKVSDHQDGLCFVSVTTGERWLYNLDTRSWTLLPALPGVRAKSMVAYAGFSIQLRVDIQP
jgi:hypothetical protein